MPERGFPLTSNGKNPIRQSVLLSGQAGIELVESTALRAASTKEHVTDIINEVLEELVRQYYELPSFSILDDSATKAWKKVRLNFFAEYRQ
ncbi:DUF4158 domain-containing protein [Endozoicomonas acroporae]|uniref:DUF4158 domain-containing protein n=2 Tax=Endozoicomonas acroporae TaxID=1701104 RepID=UPI0013D0BA6B|nr:DUF4158 domain-containing protein [Endozoicomonas acroporae]